jgi:enolase
MSTEIKQIHAREILDSRGNPTVEVDIYTSAVALAGLPYRQGRLRGSTRPWSCEIEEADMMGKESSTPSRMSTS